ncbi:hypothetical protein N0B16_03015 [Chryseobacterium sp. GMJ5]|uniref:Redox-active disulfide protein 2 n=1 Tax=Chryseobacterium gilvum TaxID=2976534 RepID=A0ABT2VTT0_9FLAO|nr:hypothetical protein [Chryseobacterium gilvum]MCU7613398.1 hypothetical protein [Chryseobacterium gilvum]
MQKKILSDQSLEELQVTQKKTQLLVIIFIVVLCILTGASLYLTLEKRITIFAFLPICFLPVFIYSLITMKNVKNEIKTRERYISMLQNK